MKNKNGGLRPIAVGEVLRRLTSKFLSRAVQSDAFDVLTPLQVGVGVKAGCGGPSYTDQFEWLALHV